MCVPKHEVAVGVGCSIRDRVFLAADEMVCGAGGFYYLVVDFVNIAVMKKIKIIIHNAIENIIKG